VEFFKVQHVSTPKTSAKVRKRLSVNLRGLDVNNSEDGPLFVGEGRHSILMDKYWTPEKLAALELSEPQKALLRDALRIFTTFLEDGAPHWACVEKKIVDDIRNILKSGEAVDIGLFNRAQAQIYGTMQSDTFPRFIKAIIANPEKYSSGEKFELPEDLIQALKSVASAHELMGKDVTDDGGASVLVSPRMVSRRMQPVTEE
jgi:hypothetical protein